ncbi:MAG: hypothetical protein V2A79_02150 [Planctomycetota bacterium]
MALLAAGGCGGAEFGESIMVPQERHTAIDDTFGPGQTLRLPAEAPFNVADAQRFSQGKSTAESSATAAGRARCSAQAGADGKAWAEFQLGHVLTNRTDQPIQATVTFNVTYGYRMNAGMSARAATADKCALKIYIMDSNRRVVKRMLLADLDPAKGPVAWTGTQTPAFDLTLEPRLAYHFVVAGRVELAGDEERSPSAEIELQSLDLKIARKS